MTRWLIAGAILLAWIVPAHAQRACAQSDRLVKMLNDKYGETLSAHGVTSQGSLMELFVSDDGSWTLTIRRGLNVACIVSSGRGWQDAPPTPPGDPT